MHTWLPFCAVKTSKAPPPLDPNEPENTAKVRPICDAPVAFLTQGSNLGRPDSYNPCFRVLIEAKIPAFTAKGK